MVQEVAKVLSAPESLRSLALSIFLLVIYFDLKLLKGLNKAKIWKLR